MVHFFYIAPREHFLEPITTTRRSVSAAHRKFLGVSYVTIRAYLETTYRATLEHVARGAEFRNFRFPVFGGAKVKLREHVGSYRNHHRADTRENPFRYQHFGIDLRRFETGSGSG